MQSPSRWASRTLPPRRVVVQGRTTAGLQEESIPLLRPSFAAVGAVEAVVGLVARLRIPVSSPRVGEFCPHRICQTPASRCSLLPRPPVAQQQGPATIKVAGTHRSLRLSLGCGDSYLSIMSGPHLPLRAGEGRWANQALNGHNLVIYIGITFEKSAREHKSPEQFSY
jgi:hypothetical protein